MIWLALCWQDGSSWCVGGMRRAGAMVVAERIIQGTSVLFGIYRSALLMPCKWAGCQQPVLPFWWGGLLIRRHFAFCVAVTLLVPCRPAYEYENSLSNRHREW